MRISTLQMVNQARNAILDRQSELSKTQQQLATGRKIVSPADDPLGAVQSLTLQEAVQQTDQYIRNGSAAQTRLELQDSALANVSDVLQTMRERLVQAANSTLTSSDRQAIALDIREGIQSLLSLANTRESNGDYLFAGHAVDGEAFTEAPAGTFTYNGDSGQRFMQIGSTRQVATNDPGDDIFVNIPYSGGGTQDIFTTLSAAAADLEAGTIDTAALDDVDAALDTTLAARARAGSRLKAIEEQQLLNEDSKLTDKSNLSSIRDLDYAEAVSRLQLELAGLQASQQSFALVQNLSLFNYL